MVHFITILPFSQVIELALNFLSSQVLTKEFYNLQNSSEKKICDLESETGDYKSKLEVYRKLEEELDDVVMQAAEGVKSVHFMFTSTFVCSFR